MDLQIDTLQLVLSSEMADGASVIGMDAQNQFDILVDDIEPGAESPKATLQSEKLVRLR